MTKQVKLLLIDDDASTRRLVAAALAKEADYRVTAAATAAEGLQLLQKERYDIVLSYLQMPAKQGFEVLRRVRDLVGVTPILVLSTSHSSEMLAQALQHGADDYLQKPVDLKDLRRAVAHLVERKNKASDSNAAAPKISTRDEGTFVELTVFSDVGQVERLQLITDRLLDTVSLDDNERHDLRLALEEIVRNALEWGNQFDPNKKLHLSYCLLEDRITFRIEDEGEGFDPQKLNDPSIDPKAHIEARRLSGKRMGGWGIFLAKKKMDEVSFNQKGNVVLFTKFLRRKQPSRRDDPALKAN